MGGENKYLVLVLAMERNEGKKREKGRKEEEEKGRSGSFFF